MDSESSPEIKWLSIEMLCGAMPAIADDLVHDYYVSNDWSVDFYVLQAIRGFIAVTYTQPALCEYLLPQLQKTYCVLDLCNFPTAKVILPTFNLKFNTCFATVLQSIHQYHPNSWLSPKYQALCQRMHELGPITVRADGEIQFRLVSVELFRKDELVAGEIGYVIGSTYTSLTGFCKREKKVSLGKIQLTQMASYLAKAGFDFVNLGQAPMGTLMEYKSEIGGVEISRQAFLLKWNRSIYKINHSLDCSVA